MKVYTPRKNIVLIFTTLFIIYCNCQDFFVVHKYDGADYFCITNSSHALSWIIYDTSKNINLQKVSQFLPNSLHWNISQDELEKKNWTIKTELSDLVLDRRWENFTIHKTNFSKEVPIFTKVLDITDVFTLPMSIRASSAANLLLCDGEVVTKSNCYWFLLEGANVELYRKGAGNATISNKNLISSTQNATYLSREVWKHFTLSKRNNELKLSTGNGNIVVLYKDAEKMYNVTHVFINNKGKPGLWKFHKVTYSHTENLTRFEKRVLLNESYFCVSMFVRMCSTCKLQLEIIGQNSSVISEQSYDGKNSGWNEIKFIQENIELRNVTFVMTTINKNKGSQFWGVDDIKQCGRNGFRMIHFNELANCQLVTNEVKTIIINSSQNGSSDNNCKEDELSRHCIPYSQFLHKGYSAMRICENYNDQVTCSCSPGYQMKNNFCISQCRNGTYGHQCKKVCSQHCQNCNHVTGICDSCTEKYRGLRCEIPPILPPKLLNYSYTNVTLDVAEWVKLPSYILQYKKAGYEKWTSVKKIQKQNSRNISISNLKPGVLYFVRCILPNIDPGDTYPSTNFTTKRQVHDSFRDTIPEFQKMISSSRKIDLYFSVNNATKQNSSYIKVLVNCTAKWCENKTVTKKIDHNPVITIDGLHPFTTYKLNIAYCHSTVCDSSLIREEITTDPEVPNSVRNLSIYSQNRSSVMIRWLPPYPPTGTLEYYKIKLVQQEILTNATCDQWPQYRCFTVTKPGNGKYVISVKAKNKEVEEFGQAEKIFFDTMNETVDPTHSELLTSAVFLIPALIVVVLIVLSLIACLLYRCFRKKDHRFEKRRSLKRSPTTRSSGTVLTNYDYGCALLKPTEKKETFDDVLGSKPVPIQQFADYVKYQIETGQLMQQYKNNFGQLDPDYEEIKHSVFEHVDIIFTSGHRIPKVYLVAKVPKSAMDQFWNFVWDENVEHIILLDYPQGKNYWPKLNTLSYGKNLSIECIFEELHSDHESRKFRIKNQNEDRIVSQLRFPLWSVQEFPSPLHLVTFLKKMSKIRLKSKSPILVHCSSGFKGAGFALLCDICLRTAEKDGFIDVLKNSLTLDNCNLGITNSYKYFELAHLTILECLLASNQKTDIDNETDFLKFMSDLAWLDKIVTTVKECPLISPLYVHRISSSNVEIESILKTLNGVKIAEDVFKKNIVLTKQPSLDNFEEFWTLVLEIDTSVIISLNESSSKFSWTNYEPKIFKNFEVKVKDTREFQCYDWITIEVDLHGKQKTKTVQIFSMINWCVEDTSKPNITDFLQFFIESYRMISDSTHVIITCQDGTVASGLYLAMAYGVEKMKEVNKFDVCTAARIVRQYRQGFGREEELKFLWKASEHYQKQYQLYET